MAQQRLPREPEYVPDSPALAVWRRDPRRVIEIGGKYRANPKTTYCWTGCPTCYPGSNARCWQRRTELEMTYRVREELYVDYAHGLGRAFLVSLVRPTVWTFRAFTMGNAVTRDLPRAKWHTATGIVWEAQLGERL